MHCRQCATANAAATRRPPHHAGRRLLATTPGSSKRLRCPAVFGPSAAATGLLGQAGGGSTGATSRLVGVLQQQQVDVQQLDAQQGLAAVQELGSQAAAAASAAVATALHPLDLFPGSLWLNLLFFVSLGVLSYSLLVLSPRQ